MLYRITESCFFLSKVTSDEYANEWQKAQLMPKIGSFEYIGGWGLTELNAGSDNSGMQTTCSQLPSGDWLLNGNKRWVGNADKEIMVVFAKDSSSGKMKAFILLMQDGMPGLRRAPITNKMSMRGVRNMQLHFEDLVVADRWRLEKVDGFQSIKQMLAHSRLYVSWLAAAVGVGIYDHTLRYIRERQQFKRPIAKFQLVQEKLVRIMGNVQACLHLMARLTRLAEENRGSIGKFAMAKAWVTAKIREAAALGREMLGGNGVILDHFLMRAFIDIEGVYTYEGTYDINTLVAGRELTGHSAFK